MRTRRTIRSGKTRVSASYKLLLTLSVVTALIGQMMLLPAETTASAAGTTSAATALNTRPGPNFDINLTKYSLRLPSPAQPQALDALKMLSGSYIKGINLGVTPTLSGAIAVARARADLVNITNLSPLRRPFAQAALGARHFAKDDATAFEARTNEQALYGLGAEPGELLLPVGARHGPGLRAAPHRFQQPEQKQFTFDAVVAARVQVPAAEATRYKPQPNFDGNFRGAHALRALHRQPFDRGRHRADSLVKVTGL